MCNTTHHIKNTCVVCHTLKTLYDVFPLILIICLFSTCLSTYLLHSLNVFYVFTEFLKLDFFFHMITFSFSCVLYLFNLNSQDYSDIYFFILAQHNMHPTKQMQYLVEQTEH